MMSKVRVSAEGLGLLGSASGARVHVEELGPRNGSESVWAVPSGDWLFLSPSGLAEQEFLRTCRAGVLEAFGWAGSESD